MSKSISKLVERDNQIIESNPAKDSSEMKDLITNNRNILTINNVSMCQICKESFNNNANMPYLFKCGHFFCKNCILSKFVLNNSMIKCPEDETKVNSIHELKILNNLISNETEVKIEKFCEIHPNQTLSHFIENTKEIVCVFCAFSKFKKFPNYEIKELKEKSNDVLSEMTKIVDENQTCTNYLQSYLLSFNKTKNDEQAKVHTLFSEIIKQVEEKRDEIIATINSIYDNNTQKTKGAIDNLDSKLKELNKLKINIENYQIKEFDKILDNFSDFSKDYSLQTQRLNFEFIEYKFVNDDITKLSKFLNSICDIKSKPFQVNFFKLIDVKIPESPEISDQDDKKNKPKSKREYIVENSSISDIQKRNDIKVKLPENNNDDHGFSKLKKELLFTHNNRSSNPNSNILTFEGKNSRPAKSSNLKQNALDFDHISSELDAFKNKKKQKTNEYENNLPQNFYNNSSHFGDN